MLPFASTGWTLSTNHFPATSSSSHWQLAWTLGGGGNHNHDPSSSSFSVHRPLPLTFQPTWTTWTNGQSQFELGQPQPMYVQVPLWPYLAPSPIHMGFNQYFQPCFLTGYIMNQAPSSSFGGAASSQQFQSTAPQPQTELPTPTEAGHEPHGIPDIPAANIVAVAVATSPKSHQNENRASAEVVILERPKETQKQGPSEEAQGKKRKYVRKITPPDEPQGGKTSNKILSPRKSTRLAAKKNCKCGDHRPP